ncbi:Hint domain-containing protein [Methylorubrum populi]|uniref:Hint domain-containing protein n=1 Tax=Methylorubrum populi TaxID=223967 RepID=UPI0031FA2482
MTGTRIRTKRGEIAVEDLQIGDLAVTASGAHKPIRWIGHRLVAASEHADPQAVWPVRIGAGALAMGVPVRDLLVSPDHCLVFDDVLVPAKHLINDATIRQEPVEAVGYWHIELDSHEALLAEGAPAESYRDCGMHAFFEGAEGWGMRVGDKAPVALLAPHALSGPRLHGVKAFLIARAKHLGARRQDDPSLQLVADGQVLTPVAIESRRFTFDVPEGTQELVLRSRRSVPAHWIAENEDRRSLGVRVSDLRADDVAVAMTDAQLSQGWNAVEPNGSERWTDGSAHLPVCRRLSFSADWFLGYPVEPVSEPMPVNVGESFARPVLRLVANG